MLGLVATPLVKMFDRPQSYLLNIETDLPSFDSKLYEAYYIHGGDVICSVGV